MTPVLRRPKAAGLTAGFREAGLTALVALVLMVPIIGLHAASQNSELVIRTRFTEIIIAAVLVFLGRLALVMVRDGRPVAALGGGLVAAAPLLCAGVTAQWAVRKAELAPGKLCAVFGCGGLGQYGIQLAKLAGASVAAIDAEPAKLEEARRLGAYHAFLAGDDPGGRLRRLGGADACLNFAPSAAVWGPITEAINPRGWIISVAMVAEPVSLSLEWLTFNGVRITGTAVGGRQELRDVLALAARHPLQVGIEAVSLDQADVALDRLAAGRVAGRSVIDFSRA